MQDIDTYCSDRGCVTVVRPSGNLAEKFLSQLAQTRLKVLFSDSQGKVFF